MDEDDLLSIGADRTCGRCGKENVRRHKIRGVELVGDRGISNGWSTILEERLCSQCSYELDEWLYGEDSPRTVLDLTLTVRSDH